MPADIYISHSHDMRSGEAPVMLALRDMQKAIAASSSALTFETSPTVLGDALCELAGLQTELDALRLHLVNQCRTNGVPQSVGLRTTGQYLAARTNNTPTGANIDTWINRWLRDFPIFQQALADRDMSLAHLRYIKKKLASGRSFDDLRADQQYFVDTARCCSFDGFTQACDYWLVHIDPDGAEPKDQIASAGLTMRKGRGGRGHIAIEADAITYAAIKKMIDHETNKLRGADTGNDRTDSLLGKSLAHDRLAALISLCTRGFQRKDGSFPTPLINLVMSPKVAEWATNQLLEPKPYAGPVPVDARNVDGRCELIDGTPVHPLLAVAVTGLWALDTPTLCRYVIEAKDRIIDYSHNVRVAPEHLRNAAHIEHRGRCAVPGCNANHDWLQIDHIDPHSNGGATALPNLEPQCPPDNAAKGATLGHIAHKDRPNIAPYKPGPRSGDRGTTDDEDDAA